MLKISSPCKPVRVTSNEHKHEDLGSVQEAVKIKKSVRLDDPGKIVLNGYTPGSRSAPRAMWAKNLLRSPTRLFESGEELESFDN
jgi:hypothetical protein